MRNLHFPNIKRVPGILGGLAMTMIALSPQDAISNIRSALEFFGGSPPEWFAAGAMSGPARVIAAPLSLGFFLWGLWPAKKRGFPLTASKADADIANQSSDGGLPSEGNKEPEFSLRYTDPDRIDHTSNLAIHLPCNFSEVVAIGRFAILTHYLHNAKWTWCLPKRLFSGTNLKGGEVVEVPYFSRPSARRNVGDKISAIGETVPLNNADMNQGIMVRIQIIIHLDGTVRMYDRLWQFRRASGVHFTDVIELSSMNYSDDSRVL